MVLHSIRALCQLLVLLLLAAATVQTRIIAPKLGEDVFVVINLKISMVVVCTFVNSVRDIGNGQAENFGLKD